MKTSLLTIAFALACPAIPVVRAQVFERIDVNDQGVPGNNSASGGALSDDARFVAFVSVATNLGVVGSPGSPNLFVRDRVLGTTSPISLGSNPYILDATMCISGDGNRIGFSRSLGLCCPTQPHFYTVYDRTTQVQYGISVPGSPVVGSLRLNYDGRFAAVTASASGGGGVRRAYRVEIETGTALLCSVNMDGTPAPGFANDINDDGTRLLFESPSDQIVPGDSNGFSDAFLLDIPGNVYMRVAHAQGGAQPNDHVFGSSLSGNGRYVSFHSSSTNLDASPSPAQGNTLVYLHDARLQTTQLISQSTQGVPFTSGGALQISGLQLSWAALDGRSVAFHAAGSSFTYDIFFRDTEIGITIPVSPGSAPEAPIGAGTLGISADGRNILLRSIETGNPGRILLAKFGPLCSSSGYCASLPNSTGAAATIGAQGDASRTLNNLVIAGLGLPDTAYALLVSGASAVDPGAPFGNGLLCIGGGMIRHGVHVASGGVILDAQDVNGPEYTAVSPGDTRYYQIFFRDPPAGGALFNTTDAVAVTFCW